MTLGRHLRASYQGAGTWVARHAQVALASLGRLVRSPLSTLMTVCVIGIALAFPAGLYLVVHHIQQFGSGFSGAPSVSVFLRSEVDAEQRSQLAAELRQAVEVDGVQVLSPEQALQEFRQFSGFGGAFDALEENPLPGVLIVETAASLAAPSRVEAFAEQLRSRAEVELVQVDLQWVRRFHAIMDIAVRAVAVIGVLLGLAVLLIVGNTVRLEIESRHAEIEVSKLVGATDSFVRRPFLYGGFWYGLFGGLIAWVLVTLSLWALAGPVQRLAGLYDSNLAFGTGPLILLKLTLTGALVGWGGSWLAVGRHLDRIEPR